jgi:hypothetical protein
MKPHRGTLILVLGVLSLILCAPLGIAALVMGNGDLKLMAAGEMDPAGKDLTNIGRILGIIACVFLALAVLGAIIMTILAIAGGAAAASAN